jgi:peptidyl-prolyl cis-trans isomerase A (cyclophilin A)
MARHKILALAALLLSACSQPKSANEGTSRDERAPDTYHVTFETSKGPVVLEVIRAWAPLGADRFYTLAKHGFFDGARFFRVIAGFVVQFGIPADPALNAQWRNAKLADDPVAQSNRRGTVSFATSGPNSRTTQVFINLANNARLDKSGFAPFGAVSSGMEIVDQFYSEYADGPPLGPGPSQTKIETEGNAYLERDFPKLDYIKKATVQ